jgi:hypothetical protein
MNNVFWSSVGWIIAASGIGFAISAFFAGRVKLSRHRFLIPYVSITGIFLFSFVILNDIDIGSIFAKYWTWGILAGGLLSIYLIKTVKAQLASRQSYGAELVVDMAWAGLVYGMVDALFLNIMPVIAVWIGTAQFAWATTLAGKIGVGLIALIASLLVTLTYHLGYPEFRNKRVVMVLLGNSLITLAFLLGGNPLGSLISHTAMHLAAVLQGPETTIQLPPHYQVGYKPG